MLRNGYGHMVLDAYVHRLREMRAERAARLRALSTRSEALAYQERIRAAINAAFSPRPARTPLNARVTGTIERPQYRIEKIVFESRPQFQVTANLYLPHALEAPAPAVLGTCGHSAQGKAADLYQGFCQRLAHAGFVVLIYDPINQGERDQYALLEHREAVESCTRAAPSCFVTTFLNNLENELPSDCEQYPPGVLGAGPGDGRLFDRPCSPCPCSSWDSTMTSSTGAVTKRHAIKCEISTNCCGRRGRTWPVFEEIILTATGGRIRRPWYPFSPTTQASVT
ncbi:MAG: hypothetical protein U9R48_06930 [Chloroflexota bacterium]|nr:hypothetical protein [Chloroflexota bacterium]